MSNLIPCSALRCGETVGPDGCFHDPSMPFCAADLSRCPICRDAIAQDYPAGGVA